LRFPILTTERLRLRAFKASDLDAYAAMQANPEVMRYLVTGRTSTPVEVWRTMATSLGAWALRGYGMWACEKIDDGAFVGSVGIFQPLDWPEPEIAYSLDRAFWRQGLATDAAKGGSRLAVRALSRAAGCELHPAGQSYIEARRGTARRSLRTDIRVAWLGL
jgi:RimJ/RimL family protein N-acetyltransferase